MYWNYYSRNVSIDVSFRETCQIDSKIEQTCITQHPLRRAKYRPFAQGHSDAQRAMQQAIGDIRLGVRGAVQDIIAQEITRMQSPSA